MSQSPAPPVESTPRRRGPIVPVSASERLKRDRAARQQADKATKDLARAGVSTKPTQSLAKPQVANQPSLAISDIIKPKVIKQDAMNFGAFLVRHGFYPTQAEQARQRIINTRSFGMDLIAFLNEPTTRAEQLNDVVNFIKDNNFESKQAKSRVTFKQAVDTASARKSFTPNWDPPTTGGTPSPGNGTPGGNGSYVPPAPNTDQSSNGQQSSEPPEQNTSQSENGQPQQQSGQQGQESQGEPTSQSGSNDDLYNRLYGEYKSREGSHTKIEHLKKEDGTPFSQQEWNLYQPRIEQQFDQDASPINPNYLGLSTTTYASSISRWTHEYGMNKPGLEFNYLYHEMRMHQLLENIGPKKLVSRRKRIEGVISNFVRAEGCKVYYMPGSDQGPIPTVNYPFGTPNPITSLYPQFDELHNQAIWDNE